jgi:uncharacterized LabA/DUF88 family protein
MFSQANKERIALFIDGDNLYGSLGILRWHVDFIKLRKLLTSDCAVFDCFYYTSWEPGDERRKDFNIFLVNNGFTVRKRNAQKIMKGGEVQMIKADTDILMTLDLITMQKNYDIAVLVTGDGDFCPVIDYLRSIGKRVVAVSAKFETTAIELVNSVDRFVDLATIRDIIERIPMGAGGKKDDKEN